MSDTSDHQGAQDPVELREEVEEELEELVDEAAAQERDRMAERDEQGVDDPS